MVEQTIRSHDRDGQPDRRGDARRRDPPQCRTADADWCVSRASVCLLDLVADRGGRADAPRRVLERVLGRCRQRAGLLRVSTCACSFFGGRVQNQPQMYGREFFAGAPPSRVLVDRKRGAVLCFLCVQPSPCKTRTGSATRQFAGACLVTVRSERGNHFPALLFFALCSRSMFARTSYDGAGRPRARNVLRPHDSERPNRMAASASTRSGPCARDVAQWTASTSSATTRDAGALLLRTPRLALLVTPGCSELDTFVAFWLVGGSLAVAHWSEIRQLCIWLTALLGTTLLYVLVALRLYVLVVLGIYLSPKTCVGFAHSRISSMFSLTVISAFLLVASRGFSTKRTVPRTFQGDLSG